MSPHERLEAWQVCHQLVLRVYQVTNNWPRHEIYGLVSQTRRCAFSAPANIAEGAAKSGKNEFARFLDISLGSLGELEYCIRLAGDLSYLTGDELKGVKDLQASAGRLTRRLHQAIVAKSRDSRRPER